MPLDLRVSSLPLRKNLSKTFVFSSVLIPAPSSLTFKTILSGLESSTTTGQLSGVYFKAFSTKLIMIEGKMAVSVFNKMLFSILVVIRFCCSLVNAF